MGLNKIVVIPAHQSPLKPISSNLDPESRLELVRIGLRDFENEVEIDDQEIRRGGLSYTIETIEDYARKVDEGSLFLIVGMDQFLVFDQWQDFEKILKLCNLIVTSRPGSHLPLSVDELPPKIQELVKAFQRSHIELTTGRFIEILPLDDLEISSEEIRRALRRRQDVSKYLTLEIEEHIREKRLYEPIQIDDAKEFCRYCLGVIDDKKGFNAKGFDLTDRQTICDFAVIASGTSTKHAASIAHGILEAVKNHYGITPQSFEGIEEGRWILLDYGVVMIHIFYDFVRLEYKLESLWKGAQEFTGESV